MTFPELVAWVETALQKLEAARLHRTRVAHLARMHSTLTSSGAARAEHWKEWDKIARKCARILGQPAPDSSDLEELPPDTTLTVPSKRPIKSKPTRWGRHERATRKPSRRAQLPPAERYEISPPFREALDAIAGGKELLFVTGRAGTGKSTFIQMLRNELPKKNIVVLAPTGIAALNAGGQTIHSFFRFPPKVIDPAELTKHDDPELFEKIDILVVDEVSMVRADLLDAVETALRINRNSTRPFGGAQVLLVGDLFQLPPVPPRGDDALSLRNRYDSLQFFGANCLRGVAMTRLELSHVYRQADQTFISLLGNLRVGRDIATTCAELNRHCAGRSPTGPHLVLVPRNDAADRENMKRIEELPGRATTYSAVTEGIFREQADRLPAPPELTLKPQTQVMFTKNDPERRWVNGSMGIVTRVTKTTIHVELENGSGYDVEPEKWENIRYEYDRKEDRIVQEVIGSYQQFPLMPAWAVTIHKAQGLTLSRVHVDFGSGAFAEGQAYVALSRCRRMSDLSLARPLRTYDVKASAEVANFYASYGKEAQPDLLPPGETATIVSWDIGQSGSASQLVATLVRKHADVCVLSNAPESEELDSALHNAGFIHLTRSVGPLPVLIASRESHESIDVTELLGEQIDGFAAVRIFSITLLGVSFPQGELKTRPWDAMLQLAARSMMEPLMIAGDFQTGGHFADEKGATLICADRFTKLSEIGWIDLWRSSHSDAREWSWINRRGNGFRIDHAFASPVLAERVVRCDYSHDERTQGLADHSMQIIEFRI
ncbi:MAG TPA: AAA family ATPase [Thermoanaerobaculia bacterium]|nr:AAA family ATPase [Thermoanaerobaculia bacterium]